MSRFLAFVLILILNTYPASAQFAQSPSFGAGQIPGTITNDNACVGCVGQPITASGSAVSITANASVNIASTSLTAGDWMVYANYGVTPGASANTVSIIGGISTTSATLPAGPSCRFDLTGNAIAASTTTLFAIIPCHLQLSTTTPVYLVGYSNYVGSGLTGSGSYVAIRIR